jgi:hypothetical protein
MDETIRSIEILAPYLPREHLIELCSGRRAFAAWREAKKRDARIRYQRACQEQIQLARRNADREMRFVDGAGYHRLSMTEYFEMKARLRYGHGIFHDKAFVRRVERDHPEMRVPRPPRRFHPVNGFKESKKEEVRIKKEEAGARRLESAPRYGARSATAGRPTLGTDSAGNRESPGRGVSLRAPHETATAPSSDVSLTL